MDLVLNHTADRTDSILTITSELQERSQSHVQSFNIEVSTAVLLAHCYTVQRLSCADGLTGRYYILAKL